MIRDPLTKRDAARLGIEACSNALDLVQEAVALIANGGDGRALSLSVLALEEIGKGWAALIAQMWGDDPESWDSFWSVVEGTHNSKLDAALFLEKYLPRLVGKDFHEMSKEYRGLLSSDLNTLKQRGFYVDFRNGVLRTPRDIANERSSQEVGAKIRKSVVAWGIILEGRLNQDLEKRLER